MFKPKIGDRIRFKRSANKDKSGVAIVVEDKCYSEKYVIVRFEKDYPDIWSGVGLRDRPSHEIHCDNIENTDERIYDFVDLRDITTKKIPRTKIAERLYKNNILSESKDYLIISYKE